MKIAVIGSRGLEIEDMEEYLPAECDEIVSGGAAGVDSCAARYALSRGLRLTELLPEYKKYGRAAPIVRNRQIVECVDEVIAFWDGKSKGTKWVIDHCRRCDKPCRVIMRGEGDE